MNAVGHCMKKSLVIVWGSGAATTTFSRSRLSLDSEIWEAECGARAVDRSGAVVQAGVKAPPLDVWAYGRSVGEVVPPP